jgi:hypothetical protein
VLAVPERMSSKSTSICTACWPVRRCTLCTPRYTRSLAQWILPCQIDRTGPRSITVISMGSVLLPDRSSSRQVAGHSSAPCWTMPEREPFGGSKSRSVHFGGSNSACVHFGGSCLLECSRGMRYREFDVSSLRALPGIMTPGLYKGHALPRIWRQYHRIRSKSHSRAEFSWPV